MTSEQGAWARPNTETSQPSDSDAEVARPRAERDAGMAPLSASQRRDQRGGFARRAMVAVLVVLFVILLPITITAAWGHRTVLNTDQFTRTITPIATDPAVTAALSREITDQLFVALDPQARVAAALPPKAAFLAAPITNGAKGYVQQAVDRVLNSPQFQTLWIEANKFAHRQLVAVLRGDTKVLDTTNGDVTLNLVPLVTAALTNVQGFASSVVGRQISIPTVTATEVPAESCAKIGAALQRPISPTCGQVPLFRAAQLVQAQRAVRAFDRAVVALLIITPLLALVALAVSRRRRRTLLQLTIGGMVGLVIVRRTAIWLQNDLINHGRPENKSARSAIVHGLLDGFFSLSRWFLIAGAIVVVLALITGPYAWAMKTRQKTAAGVASALRISRAGRHGAAVQPRDLPTVTWVREHFGLLRVGGIGVGLLLLLTVNVNVWWLLAIVVVVALYEIWLYQLRPPSTITLPQARPPNTS